MAYQTPQPGSPLFSICPNGHQAPAGARFCPACSLPVAWLTCARGHTVTPGYQYCPQCGAPAVLSAPAGLADPADPATPAGRAAAGVPWPDAPAAQWQGSAAGSWQSPAAGSWQGSPAGPGTVQSHGDRLSDWWAGNAIGGGPQGSPAPATLLTWRRAGAWRLIGALLIDCTLVWVLGGLTLVLPVFGEIVILAIVFINSYLEGSTGQSLGKKAVGIYVIKHDTGEFLGGWVGIGRQLLHILDYLPLCIGFIIGLFNTRTFADMIVGSTVVVRPRAPQLPPPPPLYPVPPAQGTFPQPQTPIPPTR
jgi:uncharacterized RDD family membrane protein YckC